MDLGDRHDHRGHHQQARERRQQPEQEQEPCGELTANRQRGPDTGGAEPQAPDEAGGPGEARTAERPVVPRGVMKPSSGRADVPLQLWVVLARAFDAVERHSRASIARFGLGTTEFGVLEVLYHKGELPVCDVQRRILVESSSTTYVVDKLVKRGLVRRRHSGTDRRVVLLVLTLAGRRLIQRIFPPHADAMRRAVAALPPREQAQAVQLLRTLGLGAAERLEVNEGG